MEPKNIRLETAVLQTLKEAAVTQGKSLDEMANHAVLTGLQVDKFALVQKVLAKGHRYGAASGIREDEVVDVVRRHRQRNG
jgi:hypothetical protein